jgi:hypothetical protein
MLTRSTREWGRFLSTGSVIIGLRLGMGVLLTFSLLISLGCSGVLGRLRGLGILLDGGFETSFSVNSIQVNALDWYTPAMCMNMIR